MNGPHGRRLLWQSALILLPLLLLAGLAVWHLADARKVALEEARADAGDLARRLAERLERDLGDAHARSTPQIPVDHLDAFLYPLAPEPAPDTSAYERFLEIDGDPGALAEFVPSISEQRTPAGLPLKPLAALRLAQLSGGHADVFIDAALHVHPSAISGALLARAPPGAAFDAARAEWAQHEALRAILRPAFGEEVPTRSAWAGGDWLSVRDGTLAVIAGDEVAKLVEAAIAGERPRRAGAIGAGVWLGGRSLTGDGATTSAGPGEVARSGGPVAPGGAPGFIEASTVERGPISVRGHIADSRGLYAQANAQARWFAGVIALSTLAAIFGLVALRRSYARQVELGELKSNFVAGVSHELRAPVASVRLLAERLRAGKVEDEAKRAEYFQFIEGEARRLGTLVDKVLDFSRIERGQKAYRLAPADLAELARDTVASLAHYAAEQKVRLEPAFGDDLELTADADAEELRGALVNLIDNAIKFSPEGAAVTVGVEAGGKGEASLWVADAGPGVPEAERGRIFERFYRSGSELTRETQGAGIGLSIVEHIAAGHGGRVAVDCPTGGGSRFTITIPTGQNGGHA